MPRWRRKRSLFRGETTDAVGTGCCEFGRCDLADVAASASGKFGRHGAARLRQCRTAPGATDAELDGSDPKLGALGEPRRGESDRPISPPRHDFARHDFAPPDLVSAQLAPDGCPRPAIASGKRFSRLQDKKTCPALRETTGRPMPSSTTPCSSSGMVGNEVEGHAPWVTAHETLSRRARQRAAADAEEGQWLLRAVPAATH